MRYSVLIKLKKYDDNSETIFRGNGLTEQALLSIIDKYAGYNAIIDVWPEIEKEVTNDRIN